MFTPALVFHVMTAIAPLKDFLQQFPSNNLDWTVLVVSLFDGVVIPSVRCLYSKDLCHTLVTLQTYLLGHGLGTSTCSRLTTSGEQKHTTTPALIHTNTVMTIYRNDSKQHQSELS